MSLQNFAVKRNQSRFTSSLKQPTLKAKTCAEMMFSKFNPKKIAKAQLIIEMTQQINCHNEFALAQGYLLDNQLAARSHSQTNNIVLWRTPKTSPQQFQQQHKTEFLKDTEFDCQSLPIYPQQNQGGFVYFIKRLGDEIYKIGTTSNLHQYIQTITYHCGSYLEIVAYCGIDNYAEVKNFEFELHRKYQDKRIIGEWFGLSLHDREEIKTIIQKGRMI